jgi:hypothetical protein
MRDIGDCPSEKMDFRKIAEEKIREAMEQGEFDDLPGRGKPLQELDSYFATPEGVRLGFSVLKNSGFVPQEMTLLKEINILKEQLAANSDPENKEELNSQIAELRLKYDLLMEHYRKARRQE